MSPLNYRFTLLIITVFLKIALDLFKAKHTDFGEVFLTSLICVLLMLPIVFIIFWCCIGFILCILLINYRHETGFSNAFLVVIVAVIIGIIITIVIIVVIVITLNLSYAFCPI